MSLVETLRRARKDVAGGWSEPYCRDTQGRICAADDEGIVRFDVESAIRYHALTAAETRAALELIAGAGNPAENALARALSRFQNTSSDADGLAVIRAMRVPGATVDLFSWLATPGRKHTEVLAAFDIAILRAEALARATTEAA